MQPITLWRMDLQLRQKRARTSCTFKVGLVTRTKKANRVACQVWTCNREKMVETTSCVSRTNLQLGQKDRNSNCVSKMDMQMEQKGRDSISGLKMCFYSLFQFYDTT